MMALLVLLSGQRAAALTGGPDLLGYTFADSVAVGGPVYSFEDIAGTGTLLAGATDDGSLEVTPPFTFQFYGSDYTSCFVDSNGRLGFGGGSGSTTAATIPTAAAPNNIIAGLWRDLNPVSPGTIHYETRGVAPNRRFLVQFTSISNYHDAGVNTFQYKLFEGSNAVEVHYQSITDMVGYETTIGIESGDGTTGLQYFFGSGLPPIGAGSFAVRYSPPPPPVVTNTNDVGAGSLRQVVADAIGGATVVFDPGLSGQTITLLTGQLTIGKDLTIDASALGAGITISGNNSSRIFDVLAGNNVALNKLTITLGNASTGGGINNGGTLGLTDCTIIGNTASGSGGGIRNATATGNLTFTRGSILNNTGNNGGGISTVGGAAPDLANGIELRNVTISGNTTTGSSGGGIFQQLSYVRLYSCTITDNIAGDFGGGGLSQNSGDLHLENTIVANNDATASVNDDLFAAVTTRAGVNFIGDPTGASGIGTLGVDYLTGDPLLAPLANYGGLMKTMPPGLGSPAIDVGGASDPGGTDQRGAPRFSNGALDIGAVEYLPVVVTTLLDEDNGPGGAGLSLREAIASPFVSTITFDPSFSDKTITLGTGGGSGQLVINKGLSIDASTLGYGVTIDANNLSRVFNISGVGTTVTLDSLTITGGSATGGSGGGIFSNGVLALNKCMISGNSSSFGGGIYSLGSALTINNSTFSGNSAVTSGGGIYNQAGEVLINNSTFFGGSATFGGGVITQTGNVSINSTTITGNTASNLGGGALNEAGSILTINNSIISGNTGTTVPNGPDLRVRGTVAVQGVNLVGDLGGSTLTAGSNVLVGAPRLAPLGYYGGPTQTMHPLIGSPAIDPAGGATSSSLATDQRGFARVVDGGRVTAGAIVDIGAVEAGPVLEVTSAVGNAGGTLRDKLNTISGNPGVGHHIVFSSGAFPATITPVSELTLLSTEVFIDGSDIGGTGVQISGAGVRGIFNVSPSGVAGMHSITLRDGRKSSSAAVMVSGTLTLGNCTVANNVTTSSGGAIELLFTTSRAVFDHCTLSGNNANGGSASDAGAIQSSGTLRLTHSTVSNNTASNSGQPGGIFVFDGTLTLENSIVAGNSSGSIPDLEKAPQGAIVTKGVNLVGNVNGSGLTGGATLLTGNALLGSLGDYGGPTPTMTPLQGSQVVDAAGGSIVAFDQRGVPRPVGAGNDLGSVEAVSLTGLAPLTGAPSESIEPTLTWSGPVEATQFVVYLGTDPNNLISQGVQTSPFNPPGILAGTTYYWRVDSTVGGGVARSAVQSFTTRSSLVVTTTLDENDGALGLGAGDSLREAIADAVSGEVVTFNPSLSGKTITLVAGELIISKNLTIDGSSLPIGIIIDANGSTTGHRVFQIITGKTVGMDSLTITGGDTVSGGGIYSAGNLSLNRCSILRNSASFGGGGLYNEAGVLTVTSCTITDNSTGRGGGIFNGGVGGTATIVRSTVSGNEASLGGGGLWLNQGDVTINNSIIAGNTDPGSTDVVGAPVVSQGINLLSGDPLLSPLGYYGGSTQTMHPLVGSPAIDPVGTTNPGGTDQRGFARLSGTTVDIGAVEVGPVKLVTITGDGSGTDGTLRNAIANATVPGTVIRFAASFNGEPGDVINTASVLALPAGRAIFLDASDRSGSVTVNGIGTTRLFTVNAGSALAAHSLTVTGGNTGSESGGLYNDGGTLTLNNSIVKNNTGHLGGGIYCNNGPLTLTNTTVSGNHGTFQTGGLHQDGSAATLTNCTFAGNTTVNNGGAIYATGGTVCRIVQCTFSGNAAGTDTGGSGGALMTYAGAQVHFQHSTIAGNTADTAGGGIQVSTAQGVTVTLDHCIVSNNTGASANADDINGNYTAQNTNVVVAHPIGTRSGTVPLTQDPLLSPLGNWGGPTQTRYLRPGSPAIDAGTVSASTPLFDQRGRARVADGDDNGSVLLDIGAYEVGTTIITSVADSGPESLRTVVESQPGHEWIYFDGGVFDGSPGATIVLDSELSVVGCALHFDAADTASGVTLSGADLTRILDIDAASAVEIDTVHFTRGFTSAGQDGAGIRSVGDLTVRNAIFSSNHAGGSGGGIEVTGPFVAESLIFTGNSATAEGGGLRYNDSGTLTLTNCNFSNNNAGETGGGASSNGSWAYTTSCTFLDNVAGTHGGALYSAGTTDVTNCEYINNSSTVGDGGGLWSNDLVNVINSPFTGNTAGNDGGGLHVSSSVDLNGSDFVGNSAGGSGGGLWGSSSVALTDSTFSGNDAGSDGGGFRQGSGTATLTRSTVAGNNAGGSGGGLWSSGGATLVNATIADNYAAVDGGGIRHAGGTISLTSTTISGNVASDTGGGVWSDGTVVLANALIAGNRAVDSNDLHGDVTTGSSGNLIGDGTGMTGLTDGINSNQVGTGSLPIDARLSALGDYGGSTPTMQLLAGSPALDMGLSSGGIPITGQRGFTRVDAADIGAVETGPFILVTNSNDGGAGSLRQAIANATAPGTRILFNLSSPTNPIMPPPLPTQQSLITLSTAQLSVGSGRNIFIDASVLVDGSGNPAVEDDPLRSGESVIPHGVTVKAGGPMRILNVAANAVVGVHGVTISDGDAGAGNGGGISSAGKLTLTECTVSGNTGSDGGGIFVSGGTLLLRRSTLSGNESSDRGAGLHGSGGTLRVESCTISDNIATGQGGGIYNACPLSLSHSTVAGNSATYGGGLRISGPTTLENNILADNIISNPQDWGPDVWMTSPEAVTTVGANLVGTFNGGNVVVSAGPLVGTAASPIDPLLGSLAGNGGPTETMKLLPGSPAIDGGEESGGTPFTDQRGFARILSGGLDLGAYETGASDFNPAGLTLHAKVPFAVGTGGTMRFEISTDPDFLPSVGVLAGSGTVGSNDAQGSSAEFSFPSDLAEDSFGNLFIADSGNNLIRMITPQGVVSTVAGTGQFGYVDGDGDEARFAFPSGVAVGLDDTVYVADTINHVIRKLTRPELEGLPWTVETLAGFGFPGFMNGIGTSSLFNHPHGLIVDPSGNVFVADTYNDRIRKITPAGVVSTYAGTGVPGDLDHVDRLSAQFHSPFGVAINGAGNIFVADRDNHRICKIGVGANQNVITVAGTGVAGFEGGSGPDPDRVGPLTPVEEFGVAQFDEPTGIAVDNDGNLIVADDGNHAIRKVAPPLDSADPWEVTTVAGTGVAGTAGGPATSSGAQFNCPTGVHVLLNGTIVIADQLSHRIRRIAPPLFVDATQGAQDAYGLTFGSVIDAGVAGLVPDTTYYFRWVAADGSTEMMGENFTLVPIPTVVTTPASDLEPTGATLNGTVDPNGSPTTVTFDYSTDPELQGPLTVGTLTDTGLSDPEGLAVDAVGNVYVADPAAHKIFKISSGGVVSDFAGSGTPGFANLTGSNAQFDRPVDVAIDAAGQNLYVADELNHRIRKITIPGGVVSTVAGSGVAGFANNSVATDGKLLFPSGVAVSADGTKVYVADRGNHRIRLITGGELSTLAGDGTPGFVNGALLTARFNNPTGVAVGALGKIYVADRDNHRVRVVTASNQVLTVAGTGTVGHLDGPGAGARFASPTDVAADADGKIYVTDRDNNRLRVISSLGAVSTLAGSGTDGFLDTDGPELFPAIAAQFSGPDHVAVGTNGVVYLTESGSLRVRELTRGSELFFTFAGTYDNNADNNLSHTLTETLFPGGTYYFRIRASNFQGPAEGEILSFTTPTYPSIALHDGPDTGAAGLSSGQTGEVDFGITPRGVSLTRQFTIANEGGYKLNVGVITVPAGYQRTGGTGEIAPGASLTFEVELLATVGGTFSGDIVINSDDLAQTPFTFPITGVVLDPPVVTTLDADGLDADTATLNGSVNPEGSATVVWFEYSQDSDLDGVEVTTLTGTSLDEPRGLATDAAGNIYVADTQNNRIRKIASNGSSSTIAGTGTAGLVNGPGGSAEFNAPTGVVVGPGGVLYVTDSLNHCIRAISPTGVVSTHSGLGTPGLTDGVGSGSRFNAPAALAIDAGGTLYVADQLNNAIRVVAPDGGVTTLATINAPVGIAVNGAGVVFVTGAGSHAIQRVQPGGAVDIFAGSAGTADFVDGVGTAARFSSPLGLAIGVGELLYVADSGNERIRKVLTDGTVSTLAGSEGTGGFDAAGDLATFDAPVSVTATTLGDVLVGELNHSTIRRLTPDTNIVQVETDLNGFGPVAVSLPLSGLEIGATYYFRARATNGGGSDIGEILSFTLEEVVSSPFVAWRILEFEGDADNETIAGPLADPSHDGVVNIIKYAHLIDPNVASQDGLPVVGQDGGNLTLTYVKNRAATDLIYEVEWSTNLTDWFTVGVTEVITDDTPPDRQIITASIARGADPVKFARLSVRFIQP